jgi:hypothetical protein
VEDYAGFHNHHTKDVIHVVAVMAEVNESRGTRNNRFTIILGLGRCARGGHRILGSLETNGPVSKILQKESDEDAGHCDRSSCALVLKLTETWVAEHESCMGEQLSWSRLAMGLVKRKKKDKSWGN